MYCAACLPPLYTRTCGHEQTGLGDRLKNKRLENTPWSSEEGERNKKDDCLFIIII